MHDAGMLQSAGDACLAQKTPDRQVVGAGGWGSASQVVTYDLHRDFNDYQGYRISGFLYRKFAELFSWTIAGGYQFKAYDARTFTGSGSAQQDEYFYIANYVNVPLTDNTQLVFQHLYNQNASNNPIHDYSSSQMSLGLSVRF